MKRFLFISTIILFIFITQTHSLHLTEKVNIFFEGTWTLGDPHRSEQYILTISSIENEDFYIIRFNKPPTCFQPQYKMRFDVMNMNITTMSNQFITSIRFTNHRNTLTGESIMVSCGNVIQYTITLLRSHEPTFSVSYKSSVNTTRSMLIGNKISPKTMNETFLQKHLFTIIIVLFVTMIIISRFLPSFSGE